MKVIDLLNKLTNNEEIPSVFKIGNILYNCVNDNSRIAFDILSKLSDGEYNLNTEVEIIEDTSKENKKIEEVGVYNIAKFMKDYPETAKCILDLNNKLNEIIDKINGE